MQTEQNDIVLRKHMHKAFACTAVYLCFTRCGSGWHLGRDRISDDTRELTVTGQLTKLIGSTRAPAQICGRVSFGRNVAVECGKY